MKRIVPVPSTTPSSAATALPPAPKPPVRIDLTSLWLTKKEVAAMLKVSLRQVEKLTAAGMFVYPRYIGVSPRWSAIEVETWLHSLPQHPAAQA